MFSGRGSRSCEDTNATAFFVGVPPPSSSSESKISPPPKAPTSGNGLYTAYCDVLLSRDSGLTGAGAGAAGVTAGAGDTGGHVLNDAGNFPMALGVFVLLLVFELVLGFE